MTKARLINLLDDFAFGGVSRGLGIFDSPPIREVVDTSVTAISPDALIAPRLDAEFIVVHFPPNWRRLAFLASLRLRNPDARIIHVEHSYTRCWEAHNVALRARFRTMLRLAFSMVDQVVCVSSGQAQWLKLAAGLDASKVTVINPYSANPGLDQLPLPQFWQRRPLVVGAYGRFHEAKGFEQLIKAFQAGAMPGAQLIIGGFGPLEASLRELAGDTPGINFAGRISDVAAFLSNCDIVAVPSRWEAFGQVACEAREAGRPILVSDVDGLPEQVGQAGMIVDFSNPRSVSRAFASLNRHDLTVMAAAGRKATANCALYRQKEWARLIQRLGQRPQAGLLRLWSA